jgi:uncharacterized membrane protein
MNEALEVERFREIEAELAKLTAQARNLGGFGGLLISTTGIWVWVSDAPEYFKVSWTLLCFGVLFGLSWIACVVEANRAKVELSLHLAKCQVLAQGQPLSHRID